MTIRAALEEYIRVPITVGTLRERSAAFLRAHGHEETATHCGRVAVEARRIARRFGLDADAARHLPMIVHQRLSAVMAAELFGVVDSGILSAIGCHTTLKRDTSALDRAVFVADKIKWDQAGEPPYLRDIVAAAEHSLEASAFCYLDYLFERSADLKVVHPWAWDAYVELQESQARWGR
jgi:HD superfamily phosphohydrolase YqeK